MWHGINSYCDRIVSPRVSIGRRSYSAFHVWGLAAFALAALLGFVLGLHRGLPVWAVVLGIVLAFFTFYATALVTKVLSGEESLTFYHQLIAVTIVLTGVAWLLHQPVLLAADISLIAVGATLTFGRIGCLMVGCCHGRPCRVGVRYGAEHGAAGFTSELIDVRLFPIQAAEFLCILPIEIVGCLMIWNGNAPAAAAAWFIVSYCSTRFCFEFARWPPSYQFKWGLSQYQWISVVLVLFAAILEFTGFLPFQRWHFVVAMILVLAAALVVLERRLRSFDRDLNHPDHIRELTAAIEWASCSAPGATPIGRLGMTKVPVGRTSLGVQISASKIIAQSDRASLYSLSFRGRPLTEEIARKLFAKILNLKNSSNRSEVFTGNQGVIHLVIYATN